MNTNNFIDKENQTITVDIDNVEKVGLFLDQLLAHYQEFMKFEEESFAYGYLDEQGIYQGFDFGLSENKNINFDEGLPSEFSFFVEIVKRYPSLHSKVEALVQFALTFDPIPYLDDDYVAFTYPVLAFAMYDQKYIKLYMDFLALNDLDHESLQFEHILFILKHWGTTEQTMPLLAARYIGTLTGQQGRELNLIDFLDLNNKEQIALFFDCWLKDFCNGHTWRHIRFATREEFNKEIATEVDHTVRHLFEELNIEYNFDRLCLVFENLDPEKLPSLEEVLDEDFEIIEIERNLYGEYALEINQANEKEEFQKVVSLCSSALKHFPDGFHSYRILVSRGRAFKNLGKLDEAIADWRKVEELDNGKLHRFSYYRNLAELYRIHPTDFSQAIAYYDKSIEKRPYTKFYINRGLVYHKMGEEEKSKASIEKGIELSEMVFFLDFVELAIMESRWSDAAYLTDFFDLDKLEESAQADYQITFLLLKLIIQIANDQDYSENQNTLNELLDSRRIGNSWKFSDLDKWLLSKTISQEKREVISKIIEDIITKTDCKTDNIKNVNTFLILAETKIRYNQFQEANGILGTIQYKDTNNELIRLFFQIVIQILEGKDSSENEQLIQEALKSEKPKIKWDFTLFMHWLKESTTTETNQQIVVLLDKLQK